MSKNENVTVLVELAGGIKTSTQKKLDSDLNKTYQNALKILKKTNQKKVFVILYFGNQKHNVIEVHA